MPKKLEDCVKEVQKKGHDKNAAYGICAKSTGWVKAKGGGWKHKNFKKKSKESINENAIALIEQLLQNSKVLEESTQDQFNNGVYSSVTLEPNNLQKLWKYLRQIGFPMIPINKAHVTVMYSRSRPKGELENFDISGVVEPLAFDIFGKGTKDQPHVLVLKLKAPSLETAHKKLRNSYGLKPTYPTYEPHLTLVYNINGIFPGIGKMTTKRKKIIMNILNKMIPELPKRINIMKHSIEPLNTNWR
jgi:hypothetical protein